MPTPDQTRDRIRRHADAQKILVAETSVAGSMPNGSFPVTDEKSLRSAIKLNGHSGTYSKDKVRAHIRKRAAALGLTKLIPPDWDARSNPPGNGMQQEATTDTVIEDETITQEGKTLSATIILEQVAKPIIIQDSTVPEGTMRIKAPFYVGGSVSNAPGFSKKIVWQESVLAKLIPRAKDKIAAGQQKITSYARHADAIARNELPVATVVDVEQEGNVGYATVDVYPVEPRGKHVQTLVQAGALTAMSLRTNDYKLVAGKLNGEAVLLCEDMDLQGLDFAPDGPAQPTYGIQILSQEAVIEVTAPPAADDVVVPTVTKETKPLSEQTTQPLTLEEVRTAAPEIIEQIEAPLRQKITELTASNEKLVQSNDLRLRDTAIKEYASKTSNPEEFSRVLTELCAEEKVTTKDGVNALVAPLLVAELERSRSAPEATPAKPKRDQLLELFGANTGPKGNGTPASVNEDVKTPALVQEQEVEMTAAGLQVPGEW